MIERTDESSQVLHVQNTRPSVMRRSLTLHHLAFGLVALGLIWRTHRYALGISISGDEAFVAINFILRDFHGMFGLLVPGHICPVFHVALVHPAAQVRRYERTARFTRAARTL